MNSAYGGIAAVVGLTLAVAGCGAKTAYGDAKPPASTLACSGGEEPIAIVQGITSGQYGWVGGNPPSCASTEEPTWERTERCGTTTGQASTSSKVSASPSARKAKSAAQVAVIAQRPLAKKPRRQVKMRSAGASSIQAQRA